MWLQHLLPRKMIIEAGSNRSATVWPLATRAEQPMMPVIGKELISEVPKRQTRMRECIITSANPR